MNTPTPLRYAIGAGTLGHVLVAANARGICALLLGDQPDALRAELATLKANAAHFDEQKRLLLEAQEVLKKEFEAAGAKVLEGAQEAFLRRAQERFAYVLGRMQEDNFIDKDLTRGQ